jgi:Domain of unknown function (DUF4276)
MKQVVFLTEEPSAKEFLSGFVPRCWPGNDFKFFAFEGKQDLEKNIERKLRGWTNQEAIFIILRDQDSADCTKVKSKLVKLAQNSKKRHFLVRIVCRELESWFVGDWNMLAVAFDRPQLCLLDKKAPYREPDTLHNPIEFVEREIEGYTKIAGARAAGMVVRPERNRSPSFRALVKGITRFLGEPKAS